MICRVAIVKIAKSSRKKGDVCFSDFDEVCVWNHPSNGRHYEMLLVSELFNVYSMFDKKLMFNDISRPRFNAEHRVDVSNVVTGKDGTEYKYDAVRIGGAVYKNGKFQNSLFLCSGFDSECTIEFKG